MQLSMRVHTAAVLLAISMGCVAGCGRDAHSNVAAAAPAAKAPAGPLPAVPLVAETSLGLRDQGIWSDLDDKLQLPAPRGKPEDITASISEPPSLLVVEVAGWPVKAYPLLDEAAGAPAPWVLGGHHLHLRPGDRAELSGLLTAERIRRAPPPPANRTKPGDRDADGIPDALDVLIGAKKTVLNAAAYTGGYVRIPYPGGDVPRTIGVCTDVVIRALRNAGVDLQRDLQEDLRRARKSYPMVKGSGDPNIDHRRVKTLLPLFLRKWQRRTVALDDAADPLRPGDIIFMDTFPSRSGPDHIGIVSDTLGSTGLPLIINNWTDGTVTAEMDLLTFVPVTHRFRLFDLPARHP